MFGGYFPPCSPTQLSGYHPSGHSLLPCGIPGVPATPLLCGLFKKVSAQQQKGGVGEHPAAPTYLTYRFVHFPEPQPPWRRGHCQGDHVGSRPECSLLPVTIPVRAQGVGVTQAIPLGLPLLPCHKHPLLPDPSTASMLPVLKWGRFLQLA